MSRKFTKNDWPRRPATLEPGSWWACVVSVDDSSGVREDEVSWACEIVTMSRDGAVVAKEAASVWYNETDQCSEAVAVFRVEHWDGETHDVRVAMQPTIRFEVLKAVRVDVSPSGGSRGGGAPPDTSIGERH